MGFVPVTSNLFIKLMNLCSFVILPSCSEGMATGVLTCMNHGLIPIVTRESGIDIQEWGIYLNDYHVSYIKEKVKYCTKLDLEILKNYHNKIFEISREKFNLQRFSEDFENIIKNILKNISLNK